MNRTTFKLGCLYAGILVFFVSLATASAPLRDIRTHSSVLVNTTNEQVLAGADLYYENCAVCHGDKALGLEEARLVFPEDHQYCERCHRANNPSTMPLEFMNHRNAFNIGNAPALNDREAFRKWGSALGLYAYMSATMPRPFPSSLEEDEYLAITSFLLSANGWSLNEERLSLDSASQFSLQ